MNATQLGTRLENARMDVHLDIWSVAHKVGVHYTQIRAWEAGTKEPTISQALELMQLYGLNDLKWLISDDYTDVLAVHTLPSLETPQIEYALNGNQYQYLQCLYDGIRGFGRIMQASEYIELERLDLVDNEQLTAHGQWYVAQKHFEVTSCKQ